MPAAAVIPAPGVSMIDAAFEMSVVGVFLCVVVGCCSRMFADAWKTVCSGRGALDGWARGEMRGPWLDRRRRRLCSWTDVDTKDEGWRIEID